MTIESTVTRHAYRPGSAMAQEALTDIIWLKAADLVVTRTVADGTVSLLYLDDDYQLGGDGTTGAGWITALRVEDASTVYRIVRQSELIQTRKFPRYQPVDTPEMEAGLDYLMMVAQESRNDLNDLLTRALQVPEGETADPLPIGATRGGKYFYAEAGTGKLVFVDGIGPAATEAVMVNADDGAGGSLFGSVQGFIAAAMAKLFGRDIDPMNLGFGAVGDGFTDDYAAFRAADIAAAAKGLPLRITGKHYLSNSYAPLSVIKWAGGRIIPAAGKTLTMNCLIAPAVKVFDLAAGGSVVFAGDKMPLWAHPEWFGAVANDDSAAVAARNTTCINAASAAHPRVMFSHADYFHSDTLKVSINGHVLEGSGFTYDGQTPNQVTRLLCTSATAICVLVGLADYPGSINAMPEGLAVRNLYVNRTVAPDIPSSCDAVRVQFCRSAELDHVEAADGINTLRIRGIVSTRFKDCRFARVAAGSGMGPDVYRAIYYDASVNIGAAGSSASVYFEDCTWGCNNETLQLAQSFGVVLESSLYGFQDTFFRGCESVSFNVPVYMAGGGGGQADVRFVSHTDDQAKRYCVWLTGLSTTSIVKFMDYYGAVSAGAQMTLRVDNCLGSISFDHNSELLQSSLDGVRAVSIDGCKGVHLEGVTISETKGTAAVAVNNSANCVIEPEMVNNVTNNGESAVQLSGATSAIRCRPTVRGGPNVWAYGLRVLGTADDRNVYDVGGIDSASVIGGAGNKLVRNNVQIVATGPTGTSEARGPMG